MQGTWRRRLRETIKHVGEDYSHVALIAGMAPEKEEEGNLKSKNRTTVVRFMSGTHDHQGAGCPELVIFFLKNLSCYPYSRKELAE